MSHRQSFPLDWPAWWARTPARQRKRGIFQQSFGASRDDLLNELRLMRSSKIVISTNLSTYERGGQIVPYANQPEPDDPGVAIYFTVAGEEKVIACDRWDKAKDNLRAVALTVRAIRGIDRWGTSQIMQRLTSGLTALPPETPLVVSDASFYVVLGILPGSSLDDAEEAYRSLAKRWHPDLAKSPAERSEREAMMRRLNAAINAARRDL